MTDTLGFTQALIRRASVTPDDAGCQSLLTDRLQAAGFQIENMPFGEVSNFWARHGDSTPVFCFAGHTDVVPTGAVENWHLDPFAGEIVDGALFGRGAADMNMRRLVPLVAVEMEAKAFPAKDRWHFSVRVFAGAGVPGHSSEKNACLSELAQRIII